MWNISHNLVYMLLYTLLHTRWHDDHIKSLYPHGTFVVIYYIACFYDAFYNLYFHYYFVIKLYGFFDVNIAILTNDLSEIFHGP